MLSGDIGILSDRDLGAFKILLFLLALFISAIFVLNNLRILIPSSIRWPEGLVLLGVALNIITLIIVAAIIMLIIAKLASRS